MKITEEAFAQIIQDKDMSPRQRDATTRNHMDDFVWTWIRKLN